MKKLFTSFCIALIGMLGLSASAASFTLNIDEPSRIKLQLNNEPYPGELVAGDNVLSAFSVRITATEGNILESVIWENGSYDIPVSNNEASFGTFTEGAKYYVHTKSASEARTGLVKLDVDKASAVKASFNETSREITLSDGLNDIPYDPEQEKTLKLYSAVTAQMPLYSVTNEGGSSAIELRGNVYFVSLPCDGTLKVLSQFPDEVHTVSLSFNDGGEGFVKKITRDSSSGEELEIADNAVSVQAGTAIYIHGDSERYLLSSYTVDGTETTFSSPQRVIVLDKDIALGFTASKYPEFTVTVSVNIPEAITARYGSTLYPGEVIELAEGENPVTLNTNGNSLLFAPSDSRTWRLASVSLNGDPVEPNYDGKVQIPDLKAGDKIAIVAEEIVRDIHAVIYLDSAPENLWTLKDNSGSEIVLETGYNHILLCSEDNPFSLAGGYGMPYVYVNDEPVAVSGSFFSKSYKFNLAEGSVAKIYVDADDEPQYHALSFSDPGFNDVDVQADEITPITDRVGYEVLAGTKVDLTPKDGKKVTVKVDDNELDADDEGRFSFIVSAPHKIEISPAQVSGIDAIEAGEISSEATIYNLQGMRLRSADARQLPAGLYIINGQKTFIK